MASPFYLFRKYQRAFIAIAAVVAMFIFVLADPLMSWIQSSGSEGGARQAGSVAARWDGGSLSVSELERLAQRRYKLSQFLEGLIRTAAGKIEQAGGTPIPPALPDFVLRSEQPNAVRLGCVTTRVLAELAEESGIIVSDEAVNHYLTEWGLRKMGNSDIAGLLGRAGLSQKAMFAGLRELLLSNYYMNSYALAANGITPEQRWEDWRRINERIRVSAAILPTEKFVAQVAEPSDAQLNALYQQFQDQVAGSFEMVSGTRLPSPNPGFKEPRRVKLQYLVANVDDRALELSDSITDAQIDEYYQENKSSQFVKTVSAAALLDELSEETEVEETEVSEETKAESEKTDDSKSPADKSPDDNESGDTAVRSPFRLTALQSEAAPTESDSSANAPAEKASGDNAEEDAPVEYVPLEEVRDQIRRTLSREQAAAELEKTIDRTYTILQSAYNPYGAQVVEARTAGQDIPAPPAKVGDYQAIAKQTGLTSEETVLLTQYELSETMVGKTVDAQSRREFVVQAMFDDQELYEPYLATDQEGNAYLICKVEDVPARVPEFTEVRAAVRAAWQQQEAAQAARAQAEQLAQQAKTEGKTVAQVATEAGFESVTSDLFSWLSFGTTPQEMQRGPRLGEAPPLVAIDEENMAALFGLDEDDKVALLNHDRSHAYVVQIHQRERTEDQMRQQFLGEANRWYGVNVMNGYRRQNAYFQVVGELTRQAGLDLDALQEFLNEKQ
jgi:hypothetical protein